MLQTNPSFIWTCSADVRKNTEETEAATEEKGIEHKNPSKALFCYLEDNFHFNWQFKPHNMHFSNNFVGINIISDNTAILT